MIYYANGCSYTWGGSLFELFDEKEKKWTVNLPEDDPLTKKRLQTVYPYHLGKYIGAQKTINESLGGGSNFRIVRKTLQYFNNLLLDDKPVNDHFVTIQWSEPSRFEFYYEEIESWANLMTTAVVPEKYGKNPNYIVDSHKTHYAYNHSTMQDFHFFISHVYCLGNFFKINKIPYLFFKHSGWETPFFNAKLIDTQQWQKLLLQFNWLHDDLEYHMQKSNIDKVTNSHPSAIGHIQWADILLKEIKKKKLIDICTEAL